MIARLTAWLGRHAARARLVFVVALLALPIVIPAWTARFGADAPVIWLDDAPPWIAPPLVAQGNPTFFPPGQPTPTLFATRFSLRGAPPEHAELSVQAMRALRVVLNGRLVPGLATGPLGWRSMQRVDVGPLLRTGTNELLVDVRNERGPAMLRLRLAAPGLDIRTGAGWLVKAGAEDVTAAIRPDDRRPHPDADACPTAWDGLRAARGWLPWVFVLGALARVAWARADGRRRALLARAVVVGSVLVWLGPFLLHFATIAPETGYDGHGHLRYVAAIADAHRFPLPTDDWLTHHPPLFYLLAAVVSSLGKATFGETARVAGLKAIPLFAGVASFLASWRVARRVSEGVALPALVCAFAALTPMNIYTSGYVANESLHAAFTAAALLCAVASFASPPSARASLLVGGLVGCALATKATALVTGSVTLGFVAARHLAAARATPPRATLLRVAALAVGPLVVAGPWYARNLLTYGSLVLANWDPRHPIRLWLDPAFHSPAWFFGFGPALVRPGFAGYHSLADACWSSYWTDAYFSGVTSPLGHVVVWNDAAMALVSFLAGPLVVAIPIGLSALARRAVSDPSPATRLSTTLLLAVLSTLAFAMVQFMVELPLGLPRMAYLLGALPVFSLVLAEGLVRVDALVRRVAGVAGAALVGGWLATLFGAIVVAFSSAA